MANKYTRRSKDRTERRKHWSITNSEQHGMLRWCASSTAIFQMSAQIVRLALAHKQIYHARTVHSDQIPTVNSPNIRTTTTSPQFYALLFAYYPGLLEFNLKLFSFTQK